MTAAVAFNRGLAALSSDAEVIAGVGPTSVLGGAWEAAEGRSKELRELFKWALFSAAWGAHWRAVPLPSSWLPAPPPSAGWPDMLDVVLHAAAAAPAPAPPLGRAPE
jgi:hypothetical protein